MEELNSMLDRIKEAAKKQNITYNVLSDKTSISISTLSKILSGVIKDPSISSISRIAKALNVTLDYLVYGEEVQKKTITPYDLLNKAGQFKVQEYIIDLLENSKYARNWELTVSENAADSTDVAQKISDLFDNSDKQGEE